ncbi:MAG: hypothetical protein ACK4GQ_02530 [Candidatus Hadarchaeales archaeon]
MARVAGSCDICGRTNVETFRCRVCGNNACQRCFIQDVSVCSNCVRKGFWVESSR